MLSLRSTCRKTCWLKKSCYVMSTRGEKTGVEMEKIPPKASELRELEEKFKHIPVEKKSLSRGLSMNKFEKDFMIFPEYQQTKEVENIKAYTKKLGSDFDKALVTVDKERSGVPAKIIQTLLKNDVFASFVPKAYGGANFCQKDLLLLTEVLAKDDLSVFTVFNEAKSAANLISIFGTQEQKDKYLPKIAAFQCKPTICIYDEPTADSEPTEVISAPGNGPQLSGVKINVVNADVADIFIVFAKRNKENRCYIIDRENLGRELTQLKYNGSGEPRDNLPGAKAWRSQ
ncbi:putative acyl-CoA dehydrogenase FadE10 [Ditylenchus destructor]|uniref:Acyl-CoA dehydrogenase FadE10 n=1 Tax=Ditylenchus destructor TaxID=166010 RepID=A0AAD4R7L0_9BILA|nr:putative acyl-CoA dehydrogenase FadE10 [Ditylenchus destructor]